MTIIIQRKRPGTALILDRIWETRWIDRWIWNETIMTIIDLVKLKLPGQTSGANKWEKGKSFGNYLNQNIRKSLTGLPLNHYFIYTGWFIDLLIIGECMFVCEWSYIHFKVILTPDYKLKNKKWNKQKINSTM